MNTALKPCDVLLQDDPFGLALQQQGEAKCTLYHFCKTKHERNVAPKHALTV